VHLLVRHRVDQGQPRRRARRDRPCRCGAAVNRGGGVHDGQREHHERCDETDGNCRFTGTDDGDGCKDVADEQRAGIAQNDARRVEVVRQKAERRTGKKITEADRGHFHHQLIFRYGLNVRQAVLLIYAICIVLGAVALFLSGGFHALVKVAVI
jgi:hypothetical protein